LYSKASRAHVLKSATEYIDNLKTKNRVSQKLTEDLKRQNAILEFQSRKMCFAISLKKNLLYLVRLLERMKETSVYTQNQEQMIKIEPEIQTTRNLLN